MHAQVMAGLSALLRRGEVLRGEDLAGLDRDTFSRASLGLVWDELTLQRARAHLEATPDHHQPYGIVHGGVWCAVVESLASVAAAVQIADEGREVVGVANSTDFLRPHRRGRVDGVAEPIHVGRTQQLWQVVLTRASDAKVVARGQVRLQNIQLRAAAAGDSGRSHDVEPS